MSLPTQDQINWMLAQWRKDVAALFTGPDRVVYRDGDSDYLNTTPSMRRSARFNGPPRRNVKLIDWLFSARVWRHLRAWGWSSSSISTVWGISPTHVSRILSVTA